MKPLFADTLYYLALANPVDSFHARASEFAEASNIRLVTSDWVIMEVADGLAGVRTRSVAARLMELVRSDSRTRVVPFSRPVLAQAMKLYGSRRDKEWSLTDCTSFVLMERMQLGQALTADRHFVQAGFEAMLL